MEKVIPADLHAALPEITVYLLESFGNATRIDYGTGHEMAFIMFLCCMFKISAFQQADKTAVVLKVFNRYVVAVSYNFVIRNNNLQMIDIRRNLL